MAVTDIAEALVAIEFSDLWQEMGNSKTIGQNYL